MQYLPRITTKNQEFILTFLILSLIYVLAFVIRLFGVVSHESTIQEVDSYFNYRSTIHLIENGLDSFNNWFDTASWYPLGRAVGETVYPGLMWTTAGIYHLLRYFNLTVEIKNVCVFIAPFFASNTAMITYLFAKEIDGRKATGFLAAAIVAIVPGYISRSVAGSFKSEVIAIFALILTFYTWIKALKNGSLFWSGFCAVSYFYMVSAWGGYVYVINVIPLHVISLLLMGRYSHRLYVAYSTLYTLGTMLAMQIPFVGFQHVQSNEHMLAMITFIVLQFFVMFSYLQQILGEAAYTKVSRTLIPVVVGVGVALFFLGQQAGFITPFTGRFYAFLDPLYARKHLPSLASDPQTHPTAWGSFFFDLNFLALLFPAGVYFCLNPLTDAHLFLIIYGTTSVYFTGVMNRFMVVLSPVAAIMASISLQRTISEYMKYYKPKPKRIISKTIVEYEKQQEIAQIIIGGIFFLLVIFTWHCTWVAATQYSSPALILSARGVDGRKITFDDFREGYAWMRMNTPENAKILAWSDYGYQINTLGNRTTLVDSNHMNNTHLAHVALTLLSEEAEAYKLCRNMGVDYVMVVFGGYTGYQSDDINKLIWMVRIAASEKPEIVESDFTTARGEFSVGSKGSRKLLNSLVYKLAYYQFGKITTVQDEPSGYDLIRGVEIGNKDYVLNYFEEAYTSQHLLVRIYKVKEPSNRF